jgi:hypothetical protein
MIASDIGATGGLDVDQSLKPDGQVNPAAGHLWVISYVTTIGLILLLSRGMG